MLIVCSNEKLNDFYKLAIDNKRELIVFLEDISLIKVYSKKGMLRTILNGILKKEYLLVIFFNNNKQVELSFKENKFSEVMAFKDDIEKRKLR
jgi:hypothetical protein